MTNASSAQRMIGHAALVTGAASGIGKAKIRKALAIWATATLALSAAPQRYESYDYAEPGKEY